MLSAATGGTTSPAIPQRFQLQNPDVQKLLALQAREHQLQQQLGQRGNNILSALQEQERANMMFRTSKLIFTGRVRVLLQLLRVKPPFTPPYLCLRGWEGLLRNLIC